MLGILTDAFGTGVGCFTCMQWLISAGAFVFFLDVKLIYRISEMFAVPAVLFYVSIVVLSVQSAFAPLVLAYDLARVSSLCDELMEVLNKKAIDDIRFYEPIAPLVTTLKNLNAGQVRAYHRY